MKIPGVILSLLLLVLHALAQGTGEFEFRGNYYSMKINEKTNSITLESKSNEPVFSRLNYYAEFILNKKDTVKTQHPVFRMEGSKQTTTGAQVTFIYSTSAADIFVTCDLKTESPEIAFTVLTKYKSTITVIRESVRIVFDVRVTEVYRKNRCLDTTDFQEEYWLDKEGVRFGTGIRSAFIYHVPKVSSLQLNTAAKELIINLDYAPDHRFLHFPLLEGMLNQKEDLSGSYYTAGQARENSFSLFAGIEIAAIPRLMLNPDGFLSAYVFTEHADWTDIRSHRAVYFGSEDIRKASKAIGGFVKHKIPVTKSVFYDNPDHVLNSQSTHQNIFSTPIATVKATDGFQDFLKQLNKHGSDICLHTPDHFTSQRPLLEEAVSFMKKKFNTVCWIDHGYNNGSKNNREALVCDGLNPSSPSYARDLWDKYGTNYFWNTYHEDFTTNDSQLLFNSSQIIPYIGFGDAAPTPNYWKHPTYTGNLYSWPTRDLLEMPDVNQWNYLFSTDRLNDFAKNRSVKFNHCYPAGGVVNKGFWKLDDQKKLVVEPEFEKTLERLASYRDSGLINLSTVRDLLNYWVACEKIKFDYLPDGKIKITNLNNVVLKGLSFALKANHVFVDGASFTEKKAGEDLIFWFDLKAGKAVVIRPEF